jgi:hypothetical protein
VDYTRRGYGKLVSEHNAGHLEDRPGWRSVAKLLTKDEARWIAVSDLADAHVKALRALLDGQIVQPSMSAPAVAGQSRSWFRVFGTPHERRLEQVLAFLDSQLCGRRLSAHPVASVFSSNVLIESLGGRNIGFCTRGIASPLFGNPSPVQRARQFWIEPLRRIKISNR